MAPLLKPNKKCSVTSARGGYSNQEDAFLETSPEVLPQGRPTSLRISACSQGFWAIVGACSQGCWAIVGAL